MVTTTTRLTDLRKLLAHHQLSAYIIPSEDSHQSEYIADCDARREFISGFTGSAGLAVVTNTKAALWTDGRYFRQAAQQLDSNWTLMKFGLPETPSKESWLISELARTPNARVGVDPLLISAKAGDVLTSALKAKGHTLVLLEPNLVDQVWAQRPQRPVNPVRVLPESIAGQSVGSKLDMVRHELGKPFKDGDDDIHGHALIFTALDDIAWLFNLRGTDIEFNPVFFAYALVSLTSAVLWINPDQITKDIAQHLESANVSVHPYTSAVTELRTTFAAQLAADRKFITDGRCNMAVIESLGGAKSVHLLARNPIVMAKAIKNEIEIQGFKKCHLHDASALITYFAWLNDEIVVKGRRDVTECTGADKLEELRSKLPDFVGLSFSTISGSGPNGAIIHYKPEVSTCSVIDPKAVYLCDSGAQYMTGTTDITRTIHLTGTPTRFEKLANTRVLQGHIALSRAVFPTGTTGYTLDGFARMALWSSGLDYRHGTGHGVGHFLNVHEGPHSISPRTGSLDVPLQPGMLVTNEPGYYHDGDDAQPAFGIRIENVLVVVEKDVGNNFGGVGYLGFESVTYVPMDKALIDVSLLSKDEIAWLDAYHRRCWDKVSPLLGAESSAFEWMKRAVAPISGVGGE